MKNRGQFFFIAAFVISLLIISLGTVYVSTKTQKEQESVYDLSQEIKYESGQEIKRGVYQGLTPTEIKTNIASLTNNYAVSNPDTEFIIIYGDASSLSAILYRYDSQGSVGIAGTEQGILTPIFSQEGVEYSNGNVKVTFGNFTYDFTLQEGQNFFIVMKKEESGGSNVVQQ